MWPGKWPATSGQPGRGLVGAAFQMGITLCKRQNLGSKNPKKPFVFDTLN